MPGLYPLTTEGFHACQRRLPASQGQARVRRIRLTLHSHDLRVSASLHLEPKHLSPLTQVPQVQAPVSSCLGLSQPEEAGSALSRAGQNCQGVDEPGSSSQPMTNVR